MLEICITLGHTHLLGVLLYSVMELVALFCMTEEMQWALCGVIKAMELHNEPIAIRTRAPLEPHIRVYITVGGGDPSKLQSPPSEGEGDPHSPTGKPHPGGGTSRHLQAELGNLADQELHQLLEDLCQEFTLCELHAPPAILNQLLGENLQGVVILMGMTRGHLSKRGRWVPQRQPSPAPVPVQPDGGWVPQGPPPQPPRPALANPDVGHLINTLASGLHLGIPRINTFSDKAMPGKTEVSFEQWYHEVQCIKDHYPELVVWKIIVQSLKGALVDMARYMGPTISVTEIL